MEQMKQTNHYFDEWWERNVRRFVREKSGERIHGYFPSIDKITVIHLGRTIPTPEPSPLFLKEWYESKPRPNISRDEFIIALAKRVEALEVALAEKGGAL